MSSSTDTLNGPIGMYKLKPYYSSAVQVELPTDCMYSMVNLHGSEQGASDVDQHLAEIEQRQESLLARLEKLQTEVDQLLQSQGTTSGTTQAEAHVTTGQPSAPSIATNGVLLDIVVNAHPDSPPLSLLALYHLLSQQYRVLAKVHTHSSIKDVSERLRNILPNGVGTCRSDYQLCITLIWKEVKHGPTLMVSANSQTPIEGEVNIARYMARILSPAYDSTDAVTATEIDTWLDSASTLLRGGAKEKAAVVRALNGKLGKSDWLVGTQSSLADIVMWSAMHQSNQVSGAPGNVKKWLKSCEMSPAMQSSLTVLG